MEEELQTTDTDANAGEGDVVEALDIAKLNEITGREFKDVDDFKKHYSNLSSFVGKKDESGEKLKSILTKAEPYAKKYGLEPDKFLEYYLENPTATEDDIKGHFNQEETIKATKMNNDTNAKLSKLEFLTEHPEAKKDFDLIDTLSKGKGVTLEEAYNSTEYKKLSNATKESKGTSVINSNNRVALSDSELQKSRDKAYREGTVDALGQYLAESGLIQESKSDNK
jgi:hypothetical protein